MPVNLQHPALPPALRGIVSVNSLGLPRFFAMIWSDALNSWEASTRRRHLAALDRLYQAAEEQSGVDCLDRLIADVDCDALEDCLVGFLAQLRNEAAIKGTDNTPTWNTAVEFVKEMLQQAQRGAGTRTNEIAANILRLDTYYGQLVPNQPPPPPPIRALPPLVIEDLSEIFRPDSPRNPFKTETLRWRNLLVFMLLLRLGLRRGESALLYGTSFKEDFDPVAGKSVHWLDVEEVDDPDPRYEQPGLKTETSRRQLPLQQEIVDLVQFYVRNYRGKRNYPHLLISQKGQPLSLRSLSEIFEVATTALSEEAKQSLKKQGLKGVSCHDLRHYLPCRTMSGNLISIKDIKEL